MVKQQGKTKEQRFVELSYLILENKYCYYCRKRSIIADEAYDKLAIEYRELAKELGLNPYADDMVEYDLNRASCRMVAQKVDEQLGPV
jgi:NAD-dependent DNA ligase